MPLWRSWASQGSEPGSQTAPGFLDAQGYALEARTQHVPLKRLRQCRQSLERATAVARLGAVGQEASRRRPAVKIRKAVTNFVRVASSRQGRDVAIPDFESVKRGSRLLKQPHRPSDLHGTRCSRFRAGSRDEIVLSPSLDATLDAAFIGSLVDPCGRERRVWDV